MIVDSDDPAPLVIAAAEVGGVGVGLLGGEVGGGGIFFWGGGVDWKKVMSGKGAGGIFEKESSVKFCGDLQFLLLEPLNVLLVWNLNFS